MSFLKRPDGGGRLEHLRANGNFLGAKGVRRLARLVADGHNTSLVRFEMSANSAPTSEANSRSVSDDEGDAARQRRTQTTRASATEDVLLNSSDDDEGGENPLELDNGVDVASVFMIPGLVKALNRNSVLRDITQTSALRLLPYARILMIAKPAIGANEKEVMDMLVDATGIGHLTMSTEALQLDSTMDAPIPVFPWLSLPSEIRRLVLRHLGSVIEQSRAQSMIDVIQTRLPPKYRQDLVLSRRQFGKLLEFASDRSTLGQKLDMRYTLRAVGCERWEVDDF